MKLTIAFLLVSGAIAACPNACSHHGECGEYDSCTCHKGFQGGDCSERVCLYNWAWVTTANGDLNFDGDLYDGTVYSKTVALTSATDTSTGVGGSSLRTQANPGGHWETWPYYGSAQEGHYYMECSNRGLCDRSTGDCVCFDGYTGTACNRMQCPEDCSDHGVCQTVKDYDSTYNYWDRDMARSCKCDPGYSGPACQTRQCPHGNDPLTKTNEHWETQFVDIYTGCEGSTTTDCGTHADGTSLLGGYARLTYTDHHGESYTTAPFAVQVMDGGSTALQVATDAEAALKALPNDVTSDTLTVTAQYCEKGKDGDQTTASAVITGMDAAHKAYRVVSGTSDEATGLVAVGGTALSVGSNSGWTGQGSAAGLTDGDFQIAVLANPICIRLKVTFVDMPGSLNLLTVDHSDVTYFGETNAQDGVVKAQVSSSVTKTLQITEGSAGVSVAYTRPSTVTFTAAGVIASSASGSTITFGGTDDATKVNQITTDTFRENTQIKVECYSTTGAENWRNLGVYTVKVGATQSETVITVVGSIAASACSSSNDVRVTLQSNVVEFGDYDITNLQDFNTNHVVTCAGLTFTANAAASSYNYYSSVGYIIYNHDGDLSATDLAAAASTACSIEGAGTRENVECSDRGLCGEDGVCKCFSGYTGDDCSIQKSIQY